MTAERLAICRSDVANEAERLIETARITTVLLRRGAPISDASTLLDCSNEYCEFALAFAKVNDGLKLRALIENWPLSVIQRECFYKVRSFDTFETVP